MDNDDPFKSSTFFLSVTCIDTLAPPEIPICDDGSIEPELATLACTPISSSATTIPTLTENPHPKNQKERPIETPNEVWPLGSEAKTAS